MPGKEGVPMADELHNRPIETPRELDDVLERAAAEGWNDIAFSTRDSFPVHSISPEHSFHLRPLHMAPHLNGLAKIKSLTTIGLIGIAIGDRSASILASLPYLSHLIINNCQIGDQGAAALAMISSLRGLSLSSNDLKDQGAVALARLTSLEKLSLNDCRIGDIGATALAGIPSLTSLHLMYNQIGDEGAIALSYLSSLRELYLYSNEIGDRGATALAMIHSLEYLNISFNRIGDPGASTIAKMPSVLLLDLAGNRISDKGASAIADLTSLRSLNLSSNKVGDQGATALARNSSLRSINLCRNPITNEGLRSVLDILCFSTNSSNLRTIGLWGRSEDPPLLSRELLDSFDAQAILAAYRAYHESERQNTLQPLNEAKLLVVGNEAVGKTSLIRFLVEDQPCNPSEAKTHGVSLRQQIEISQWRPAQSPIKLRIWDFGGQQVQRGTHRYFLTERSLYLLVLEERREDDNSKLIQQWMSMVRTHGGDSPVLVVINKSDDGATRLQLDEVALRRAHPSVVGLMRTSCNAGEYAKNSIQALRERIAELLETSDLLGEVRKPVPQAWAKVRDAITARAQKHPKLSIGEFERICRAEKIEDPDTQRALLRLLHDLGVVVAHGLRRDSTAVLGVTLLDPNWLTTAIYRVIASNTVLRQGGELDQSQLAELLPSYDARDRDYVIHMMMDRDMGLALCFALRTTTGKTRYLIPDALPELEPFNRNWPTSLVFRYKYEHDIPAGLMARFIVEAHSRLAEPPTRWRNGVVLDIYGCAVLVRADPYQQRIDVKVDARAFGADAPRTALSVVRAYFEDVHKTYAQVAVKERVPLHDQPEVDVAYSHLRKLEELQGLKHRFLPEGAEHDYAVGELLEGLEREPRRRDEHDLRWHERKADAFLVELARRLGRGPTNPNVIIQATDNATVKISGQVAAASTGAMTQTPAVASPTPVNEPSEPTTPAPTGRPWWQIAAGAAVAAVALAVVLYVLPTTWKWIVGGFAAVGVGTFLVVNWLDPANYYRRQLGLALAGAFIAAATGIGVEASFQSGDTQASLKATNEASSMFFFALSIVIIVLLVIDYLSRRRAAPVPKATRPEVV